jgi:hypothetical protein
LDSLQKLILEDEEKGHRCTYTLAFTDPFREVIVKRDEIPKPFLPDWYVEAEESLGDVGMSIHTLGEEPVGG